MAVFHYLRGRGASIVAGLTIIIALARNARKTNREELVSSGGCENSVGPYLENEMLSLSLFSSCTVNREDTITPSSSHPTSLLVLVDLL